MSGDISVQGLPQQPAQAAPPAPPLDGAQEAAQAAVASEGPLLPPAAPAPTGANAEPAPAPLQEVTLDQSAGGEVAIVQRVFPGAVLDETTGETIGAEPAVIEVTPASLSERIARAAQRSRVASGMRPDLAPLPPRTEVDRVIEHTQSGVLVRAATPEEVRALEGMLPAARTPADREALRDQLRLRTLEIDEIGPDTFRELMAAAESVARQDIATATRGRQTIDAMVAQAQLQPVGQVLADVLGRQVGQPMSAEQYLAGVRALQASLAYADRIATTIRGQAGEGTPEQIQQLMQAMGLVQAVVAQMRGATAEVGRALRVMQDAGRMVETTAPDIEPMMEAARQAAVERARRMGLEAPDTRTITPDQLAAYANGRLVAEMYLQARRRGQEVRLLDGSRQAAANGATLGDAFIEAYINSLLSSPITHVVNVGGAVIFGALDLVERGVAAGIGSVRVHVLGAAEASDRVHAEEVVAKIWGLHLGLRDAFRMAGEAWRTGESFDGATRLDLNTSRRAISAETFGATGSLGQAIDYMGRALNVPTRLMLAEDDFFKAIFRQMELHALATREAQRMIADGVPRDVAVQTMGQLLREPPAQMWNAASDYARYLTFQTTLGEWMRATAATLQNPLLKIYVPFVTTPTNILSALNERNIVTAIPSLALPNSRLRRAIQAGGAQRDLAFARLATGSAIVSSMAALAYELSPVGRADQPDVLITGRAPNGPAGEAFRRGLQPYSICVRADGGYACVSYARWDPMSGILAVGADIADQLHRGRLVGTSQADGEAITDMLFAATVATAHYMGEQPMVQGAAQIINAVGAPGMTTAQRLERLQQVLGSQAVQAVGAAATPYSAALGLVERATGPMASEARLLPPSAAHLPPVFRGIVEGLQRHAARTPILSEALPTQLDRFARPVMQAPTEGVAFSPLRVTLMRQDPIDQWLVQTGFGIPMPEPKLEGVPLDVGQYQQLLRLANDGNRMVSALNDLVTAPGFSDLPAGEQIKQVRDLVSIFDTDARAQLLAQDDRLRTAVDVAIEFRRRTGRTWRE